jgi:stage II sporulation protein P
VISTKPFWTTKPFLVACVVAIGFAVGLFVNRAPTAGLGLPTLGGQAQPRSEHEEVKEASLWVQLFRPSQPMARALLRYGMPMLSIADGSVLEEQNRNLLTYWTGPAEAKPQTLFQTLLPFLRTAPPAPPLASGPPASMTEEPDSKQTRPSPRPSIVVNGGLPLVGIYHTHDWESYISEFPNLKLKQPGDLLYVRSLDHKQRTVVTLGLSLAQKLQALGVTTVQAPGSHQSLGYDYAYTASRETAKKILGEKPSVKILIDLHRDGTWGMDTTTVIDGQRVAQLRCIIGGADQPHWEQNKAFCDSIVRRLEKKDPGMTLPTRVQAYTYNQDLLPGAVLFEVGNATNSYDEADRAVSILAAVLADVAREGAYPK